MIRTQALKHLSGAREKRASEMSGEEQLPAMEKGRSVGFIERKEVRGDGPI